MPEADKNPVNSHKPASVAGSSKDLQKSSLVQSPKGFDPSVVELGGYGLLAYSLFNLGRSLVANKLNADPEVSLAVMSQLVSLSPIFLLGPVLIFAPQGAIQAKGLGKQLARWLVVLFAFVFILFIPLSSLQRFALSEKNTVQTQQLETVLQQRKQQILVAIQNAKTPAEFQLGLSGFPEIRQSNPILLLQSPEIIRQQISDTLDTAIKTEIGRLKKRQQERLAGISKVALSISIGSLIAGTTLCLLATYLFPRFSLNRDSLVRSSRALGSAVVVKPVLRLKKFYQYQLSRPQFTRIFAILGLQQPRPSRRR
jgi:hypothetical protein